MKRVSILTIWVIGCSSAANTSGEEPIYVSSIQDTPKSALPPPAPKPVVKPPPAPPPPAPIKPSRIVRFVRATSLRALPDLESEGVGYVRGDTRAGVKGTAPAGKGCKKGWVEVLPRGWTCEDAVATTTTPVEQPKEFALADPLPPGRLVPGTYGTVRGNVLAYATEDDVRAGNGRTLKKSTTVGGAGMVTIDGTRYWRTTRGELIEASAIAYVAPSSFEGIAIKPAGPMPAWVYNSRDPYKLGAQTEDADGKPLGSLPPRTRVSVLEQSADGLRVRVSDAEWVQKRDLRLSGVTAPPPGTGEHERWFDVDLENQVLVAYEGKQPVYATLVSTGKYPHYTPVRAARIISKHLATEMNSEEEQGGEYSVADVPWTQFYDGNYALHTSYWHDGFGHPRSHGCINLAPRDARRLFAWSAPTLPPGWTMIAGDEHNPGSFVRVRTTRTPEPEPAGYAARMPR